MDLTVAATPFFLGAMEAERRWLRRHEEDEHYDAGQFEKRDTAANLTMGTASLLAPIATAALRRHLELGRGRYAKPVLAIGAAAAAATVAADAVVRRSRRRGRAARAARRTAEVGSVVAVAAIGTVATSTWGAKLSTNRLWKHRVLDLGTGMAGWTAALVGWDLIYYWNHRIMHESRFMWAIHVVHHSSERYNLSVALRQPVADALGIFVPYGLLCLLGVSPAMVEASRGINLIYQYWIHTEAIGDLGRFERIFNTASLHRVHHGVNPQYIDRNHGGILILWDRLFGTHEVEGEPVVYGLTTNLDSFSPVTIAASEHVSMLTDVARAESWGDRLSFVLRGPGWAYARHRELDGPMAEVIELQGVA